MDDLISRSAAIALMEKDGRALGITVSNVCNFKDILRTLPAVHAVPVVHARWILKHIGVYDVDRTDDDGFCHNGARMDAEDDK